MARVDVIRRQVDGQLQQIREHPDETSHPLQAEHLTWMRRHLSRVNYLLAFDHLLEDMDEREPACRIYIKQLQPVLLHLATVYLKRENIQAAYYCHFLARRQLRQHMELDQIQQVLLSYLEKDSLYCKINVLKALCSFGSPSVLVDALLELGKGKDSQLHEKIITEGLLAYTGDPGALMEQLWSRLEQFSLPIQRAVLDYIRFQSGDYCRRMLEILQDGSRDRELRFAAIRYLGRYPYPPAKALLLDFLRDDDPSHWEFSAISASALAAYPGREVTDALLQAMNSANWYIRNNASVSLEAQELSYEEMLQVLSGDDRYAREMLQYRLESKRLEKKRAPGDGAGTAREEAVAGI